MCRNARRNAGFTLIELMLALGILALLVTLAVPAYRAPLERAERGQAGACLVALGAILERHAIVEGDYEGFVPGAVDLDCRRALEGVYVFEAGVPGDAGWTAETRHPHRWRLRARREAAGAADRCAILVYDDAGIRAVMTWAGEVIEDPVALRRCWH